MSSYLKFMARGKSKKAGEDIADEFDLLQFELLSQIPGLVHAMKNLATKDGMTFEEEVRIVADTARGTFGRPRKGPPAPSDHWTNAVLPKGPRPR